MPKVWKDGSWEEADPEYAPNVYIGSVAPSSPLIGTFWFDTSVNSLKIWDGTVWDITIPVPNPLDVVPADSDQYILANQVFR